MQISYIPTKRANYVQSETYSDILKKVRLSDIMRLVKDSDNTISSVTYLSEVTNTLTPTDKQEIDSQIKRRFKINAKTFCKLMSVNLGIAIAGVKNCLQAAETVDTKDFTNTPEGMSLDEYLKAHNISKNRSKTIINNREVEAWIEKNAASGVSDIDIGGYTLMIYIQRIAYWICAAACIISIIKKCKDGDVNAVSNILIRYAVIYGCIFAVQVVLKWVWNAFQR